MQIKLVRHHQDITVYCYTTVCVCVCIYNQCKCTFHNPSRLPATTTSLFLGPNETFLFRPQSHRAIEYPEWTSRAASSCCRPAAMAGR